MGSLYHPHCLTITFCSHPSFPSQNQWQNDLSKTNFSVRETNLFCPFPKCSHFSLLNLAIHYASIYTGEGKLENAFQDWELQLKLSKLLVRQARMNTRNFIAFSHKVFCNCPVCAQDISIEDVCNLAASSTVFILNMSVISAVIFRMLHVDLNQVSYRACISLPSPSYIWKPTPNLAGKKWKQH